MSLASLCDVAINIEYRPDGAVVLGDGAGNEIAIGDDELRTVVSQLSLYLSRGRVPYWDEVVALKDLREALRQYVSSDQSAAAGQALAQAVDGYTFHE